MVVGTLNRRRPPPPDFRTGQAIAQSQAYRSLPRPNNESVADSRRLRYNNAVKDLENDTEYLLEGDGRCNDIRV